MGGLDSWDDEVADLEPTTGRYGSAAMRQLGEGFVVPVAYAG